MERYREVKELESQAQLAQNLEDGDFAERLAIIEPARVPAEPVSPDRVSLSFLGVVLALALGLGVASLVDATDTTVRGQRDIYRFLEMPPMGVIPYVETRSDTLKRFALNGAMAAGIFVATIYVFMTTQA
jgi:capsular polysaccharide biosynthesis protein